MAEVHGGYCALDVVRVPARIQMHRRPGGWRAQHPDAVVVARPSRWGNPHRVVRVDGGWALVCDGRVEQTYPDHPQGRVRATHVAVFAFRVALEEGWLPYRIDEVRAALAGRDLACWCLPGAHCHGDVLLQVANGAVR